MSKIDLSNLSLAELADLEKNTKQQIKQKQKQEVVEAYAQFQEIAKSLGVTVEEVIKAGKGTKRKMPIKYQNPHNKSQGWSGQGRKPAWLVAELEKGKKIEDFAV